MEILVFFCQGNFWIPKRRFLEKGRIAEKGTQEKSMGIFFIVFVRRKRTRSSLVFEGFWRGMIAGSQVIAVETVQICFLLLSVFSLIFDSSF